jgi:hypothetical protein
LDIAGGADPIANIAASQSLNHKLSPFVNLSVFLSAFVAQPDEAHVMLMPSEGVSYAPFGPGARVSPAGKANVWISRAMSGDQ